MSTLYRDFLFRITQRKEWTKDDVGNYTFKYGQNKELFAPWHSYTHIRYSQKQRDYMLVYDFEDDKGVIFNDDPTTETNLHVSRVPKNHPADSMRWLYNRHFNIIAPIDLHDE